ncbi:helix-turn-helix domain-containing protein [Falsiroseomonas sp. CW058]|uniref:helix-turn-helix domain-containing protein n=1 Tax=Falsiroseomonas sp. CW058 TaxID=3388664 RepID=UPI003D316F09
MAERIRPPAVSEITSLSVRKVQEMAAAGKIPGAAKLGGSWTFDPVKLRDWIAQQESLACRATSMRERASSGGASRSPASSIDAAYERLIRGKQRSASRPGASSLSATSSGPRTHQPSRRPS